MARNFDELLSDERTFVVRGETFTWRDVKPEVITGMLESGNGDDPWAAQDAQILHFIIPEDHERWKALRARDDDPVTIRQFNAIYQFLVEQVTDLPTTPPSTSAPGAGKRAASSKAA